VDLHDGLEVIGVAAFKGCAFEHINIPSSVRAIEDSAFWNCSELTTAILNNGLEEIGSEAFSGCALEGIVIPPSVRVIKDAAFADCWWLTTAILNDGLEKIGYRAFYRCRALEGIVIPPSVREIDETAFLDCSNLLTVRFCDEIEEFVSGESMRHWWNNGVHEKCLSTYCLLVRFNIPERLGRVRATQWQDSIHRIFERIPAISSEWLNTHFCSIDSKLSAYEAKLSAYEGSTMLELAIWKSEIAEQTDGNINLVTPDMKMACRIDSLTMVGIILPNVLSFIRGDAI